MCGDEKPENGFHAQSNSSLLSLSWRKFLSQAILPWVHSLLRKCWWTSSKDWSPKSSQAACTCTTTSGYLDIIRCRMYNGLSIVHVFVKVTLSFSSVPFPGKCFLLLVCGDFWRIVVFAFLLFFNGPFLHVSSWLSGRYVGSFFSLLETQPPDKQSRHFFLLTAPKQNLP